MTFSARGPFGPWPSVNVTLSPSRNESNAPSGSRRVVAALVRIEASGSAENREKKTAKLRKEVALV